MGTLESAANPPPAAPRLPAFRILLAEHFGVCFGVRDALAAVERLAAAGPVTVLGPLVHNEAVRQHLAALGVAEGSLGDAAAATSRVVITAHGATDAERARWAGRGHRVTDTTCPLVRKAHDTLAALVAAGCAPVVIGRKGHAEVLGLAGDFPGCVVVEGEADVAAIPADRRIGVVAQTTQPERRVRALVTAIRTRHPRSEIVFRDTVCRATKDRQRALENLCRRCDAIIVVGGSTSNNTRELVEGARSRGLPAWRVGQPGELRAEWFDGTRRVGVTAGTSTLPGTVVAVLRALRALAVAGEAAAGEGERPRNP